MAERIEGLNLVLLGKIGAGKSASGNTILGREAFQSKKSPTSVTEDVTVESGTVGGRRVTVYDTPGLFNTKLKEEQIQQMINENVLQRCESGPTAFLLVIKVDRFTGKEREAVEKIEKLLGEERLKKTWILFTRGDQLEDENKSIDEFVNETEALKRLVQKYDQRYHVFNNKPKGQVQELLTKIYSTYPDTIEKGAKPKRTLAESIYLEFPRQQDHMSEMTKGTSRMTFLSTKSLCEGSLGVPSTDRRIVLLGKSGVGKSSAGNTILGQEEFRSERSMRSVTCECSDARATVSGRSVTVVDTPGLFHTKMKTEELAKEIARSVYISSPGPHAFLIVFPVNMRITKYDQEILQMIEMMFGEEVLKYSIILFTHGGQLRGKSVEKLIEENSILRDLVDQCGGRFHIFNNRDMNNRDQVNDLLKKIDTMIEQNGGGHYSHQMYEDAQRREEKKHQEKKLRQEEIERAIKYTEERIRAEFEGPPRFLQERLKIMRLREEDWKQQERVRRQNRGIWGVFFSQMELDLQKEQRREEIERVIKDTERRIREEFEGPPRVLLERFKSMRLREEAEKTHQEEIERVRKETEERVRAEFEGPPRLLQERLKAMTLSEEEKKTQQEEKQRREEIERVRKETEEKIRAEFENPPRFLQERLKTIRLSMEDRIQEEVEGQERFERRMREMEETREEMEEMRPMHISQMMRRMRHIMHEEMGPMHISYRMRRMRHIKEMREMEEMGEEMEKMIDEMEVMGPMHISHSMRRMRHIKEMREMEEMGPMHISYRMRRIMEMEMREMEEMGPMHISQNIRRLRRILYMEMRHMEMRHMGMREMEIIRIVMQSELQEEIERVIKEMEENIRAEFKCPPR